MHFRGGSGCDRECSTAASTGWTGSTARRIGGQACLDDPNILAPLVAYVGEVIRNVIGGDPHRDRTTKRGRSPSEIAARVCDSTHVAITQDNVAR